MIEPAKVRSILPTLSRWHSHWFGNTARIDRAIITPATWLKAALAQQKARLIKNAGQAGKVYHPGR